MPAEILISNMKYSRGNDFITQNGGLYPAKTYLRVGNEYFEFKVKVVFYFAALRKKLVNAW